ncbi:MAG: Rrf2 family transcriptional regulator [Spartobacteria bacterium]|nr:Rrf2 family transcriptional regulator [Spartobacteria bacterium]
MKLTTKSEYSLLLLIYLARHVDEGFIHLEDICREYSIPRKYLEQLVTVLKQNRLVKARRGAMGGYALARPADQICMATVIRLMDGALAPTESVSEYFFSHTPIEREEKVLDIFRDIRTYIATLLEEKTLADLI